MNELFAGVNVFDILIAEREATSQNGRPIEELDAREETVKRAKEAGVETERVRCPYPGSRHGKPMNRAAFIALSQHKGEVLDNLAWVNLNYFDQVPPQRPNLQQATELVAVCTALPSYCFFRTEKPYGLTAELPDVIADMAKAARGLTRVVSGRTIFSQYMPTPDAAALYQYAEENKRLLNDFGACAAPETVIKEAIEALFFRRGGDSTQASL